MIKKRACGSRAWRKCSVTNMPEEVIIHVYHDDAISNKGRLVDIYTLGGSDESEWEMLLFGKPEQAVRAVH